jgi:hypothetical protein
MAVRLTLPSLHLSSELTQCWVSAPLSNYPTITLQVRLAGSDQAFGIYGTAEQLLAFAGSMIAAVNEHAAGERAE